MDSISPAAKRSLCDVLYLLAIPKSTKIEDEWLREHGDGVFGDLWLIDGLIRSDQLASLDPPPSNAGNALQGDGLCKRVFGIFAPRWPSVADHLPY